MMRPNDPAGIKFQSQSQRADPDIPSTLCTNLLSMWTTLLLMERSVNTSIARTFWNAHTNMAINTTGLCRYTKS